MALEDGNYVFVYATNTALALDITSGNARSGLDLELWTTDLTGRDAQTVHVSTDEDGWSMLYMPLTCRSLDVYGGTAAAGTRVIQWDDHGGDNQRWLITEDGGSVTVGGVSCPTVTIASKLNTSLYIGAASTARGSKCTLRTSPMRFAAFPVQSVPDGLYQIVSGLRRDVACDVTGASKASGANLELWGLHGNNNQVFAIEDLGDGTCSIKGCDTGLAVDVSDALRREASNRNNVIMWGWHAGINQQWVIAAAGNLTRNGTTVPGYQIVPQSGTNLALDACGASSKPGTNVWLWTKDPANLGQVWELRPAQAYGQGLECPADVLHDLGDYAPADVVGASGAFESRPSWVGARGKWQARYRVRTRTSSMYPGARSEWGAWTCLLDGSTANGGWGEVGIDNCEPVRRNGRWFAPQSVAGTLSADGTDLYDVEYEVRRFTADWQGRGWPAHSGSASRVCTVAWAPSLTVDAAELTPEGLTLTCGLDWPRSGNLVTLSVEAGGSHIVRGWRAEDWADGEALTVPLDELERIPQDGEQLAVSWSIVTTDGVTASGEGAATLSYGDGYGIAVDPDVDEGTGWVKTVDFDGMGSARLWVETADGWVEVAGQGTAFAVPYPLGCDYGMVAVVEDGLGGWGVWRASFSSRSEPWYLFDMDDGTQATIKCGVGEPAKLSVRTAMDHDEAATTGGGLERVRMGAARSETVEVSGALVVPKDAGATSAFRDLKACRFCWFRDPFAHLWRVAVTDASEDRSRRNYTEVSVTMRRVG